MDVLSAKFTFLGRLLEVSFFQQLEFISPADICGLLVVRMLLQVLLVLFENSSPKSSRLLCKPTRSDPGIDPLHNPIL